MARSESLVYIFIVMLVGAIAMMNFSALNSPTGMVVHETPLTLDIYGQNGRIVVAASTPSDIEIYNYDSLVKMCPRTTTCSATFTPGSYIAVARKNHQITIKRLG